MRKARKSQAISMLLRRKLQGRRQLLGLRISHVKATSRGLRKELRSSQGLRLQRQDMRPARRIRPESRTTLSKWLKESMTTFRSDNKKRNT